MLLVVLFLLLFCTVEKLRLACRRTVAASDGGHGKTKLETVVQCSDVRRMLANSDTVNVTRQCLSFIFITAGLLVAKHKRRRNRLLLLFFTKCAFSRFKSYVNNRNRCDNNNDNTSEAKRTLRKHKKKGLLLLLSAH